jgi:hypothetical protein
VSGVGPPLLFDSGWVSHLRGQLELDFYHKCARLIYFCCCWPNLDCGAVTFVEQILALHALLVQDYRWILG